MPSFLHTADWQIGKPFQGIADSAKRERLRQQRLDTVRSLRTLIAEQSLDFVVVCGDLFDSSTPDQATVSALCAAVGSLNVPVYAIPGNHDHGGAGCIWQQDFFQREREQLAPNLAVLLEAQPVIRADAVLLPCPLKRRHETTDPTAWLRHEPAGLPADLPRIVLAHGSTQGFSSADDADQASAINQIDLSLLPKGAYTYIALGDWHGTKSINPIAWYAGTPEQDRFAKGEQNQPGQVLIVGINHHPEPPKVEPLRVGTIGWHALEDFNLTTDADLDTLAQLLEHRIGTRTMQDLLKLSLHGTLSFDGAARLEQWRESLSARLIRLQLDQHISIEPTADELQALTESPDPLIAQVATALSADLEADPMARDALRELHFQVQGGAR